MNDQFSYTQVCDFSCLQQSVSHAGLAVGLVIRLHAMGLESWGLPRLREAKNVDSAPGELQRGSGAKLGYLKMLQCICILL